MVIFIVVDEKYQLCQCYHIVIILIFPQRGHLCYEDVAQT